MKRLALLVLVLSAAFALNCQFILRGAIQGTVYLKNNDGKTIPLAYAMVYLLDETGENLIQTKAKDWKNPYQTGPNGMFFFKGLPWGKYVLEIQRGMALGGQVKKVRREVNLNKTTLKIDIVIDRSELY